VAEPGAARSDLNDTGDLSMILPYPLRAALALLALLAALLAPLAAVAQGLVPAASAPAAGDGFLALVRTLGKRTAQLHAALARRTGDDAFDPEPVQATDIPLWVKQVRDDALATMDMLAQHRERLPEPLQADALAVFAAGPKLMQRVERYAQHPSRGFKTRYHGDYHLGQVLVAHNDFVIIDFEGEPARSMAERRSKHSALRDVAGMLRSFDYAMHSAVQSYVTERPDARATVTALAHQWRVDAQEAFIAGYDEVAGPAGLPTGAAERRRLLELFVLEKAAYETSYEMDNRPDWLGIPLLGLLEALTRH